MGLGVLRLYENFFLGTIPVRTTDLQGEEDGHNFTLLRSLPDNQFSAQRLEQMLGDIEVQPEAPGLWLEDQKLPN